MSKARRVQVPDDPPLCGFVDVAPERDAEVFDPRTVAMLQLGERAVEVFRAVHGDDVGKVRDFVAEELVEEFTRAVEADNAASC